MSVKDSSNDVLAPEMRGLLASGSPFDDQSEPAFEQRDDLETESESDSDYEIEPKKEKLRRPNDNAFQQQRLKAINPVITAHWLIPILLGLGVFLLPLGGAMWLASHRVEDFTIDYTQCENLASADYWLPIPDEYTNYNLDYADVPQAQWKLDTNESQPFEDERRVCKIQFHVPHTLKSPLYFFTVWRTSRRTTDGMPSPSLRTRSRALRPPWRPSRTVWERTASRFPRTTAARSCTLAAL